MENETQDTTEPTGGRPAARFSGSGGLRVAVWKQKSDQGIDNYSVRIDRDYKASDGYQSTAYLRDSDLLRAGSLLQQTDEWIEQDKGMLRTQIGVQNR
jgi:hypothetical protein